MKKMFKNIRYILSYKQKIALVVLTILLFVGGIFDLLGVSLIIPVVKSVTNPGSIDNAWIIAIKKQLSIKTDESFVILLLVLMIFIYVIKNLYIILMYYVMYKVIWKFKSDLSMRLLNCYMYQDYTFHLNKNVSDLQRNILTDVGQFYGFIMDALNMLNQIIICILLTVYLVIVDWMTTIGVLIILGSAIALLYRRQKKTQTIRGKINRETNAQLNKWILQSFAGIKEIQVLGREQYFLDRCKEAYDTGMEANRKSNLSAVIPKPLMEMVCVSGLILVMLFRIIMGGNMEDFVSILAVFAVSAFRMLPCFNSISAHISSMLFEKDSVDAVYSDIKEMEKLNQARTISEGNNSLRFDKSIKVEEVSYKYPNTDKLILENVNLVISKNESVGFVGPSGAGKSTLIDIILGLLPLEKGKITVDGKNIADDENSWHKLVGYIPQTIYLMDDTIRNNVAFGIPTEKISEEKLWNALEKAQIADFIRLLPDGLDSQIGDRGVRISGGQRQRLGIARALYHDPEILVFDEATSALDTDTEAALMEAIDGLKGQKTMLIIAHRLNTIKKCDKIYEVADKVVHETNI